MSVRIAENAGFCFGVRRATEEVERLLGERNARVFILGHLIHNRLYNEGLEEKGVRHIGIEDAPAIAKESDSGMDAVVVIRTHGVPLEEEMLLRRLEAEHAHFHVADMTCPFVKKIHRIADENTNEETAFFLLGTENTALGSVDQVKLKLLDIFFASIKKICRHCLQGRLFFFCGEKWL